MLTGFDWLRRCGSGAELLATLDTLATQPHMLDGKLGPPHSALDGPCSRCWVYAREPKKPYCPFCQNVLNKASKRGTLSKKAIVIWGYVNQLPRFMETGQGFYAEHPLGCYVHDDRRFLLVLYRHDLKSWLQDLVLYHGANMKGLLQVFPTMAAMRVMDMGEAVSQIVQREANYSMDRLRVQFYAAPAQIRRFSRRDQKGNLTFEIAEFVRLLEMAEIFRTMLYPNEQQDLYKLLHLEDSGEVQFYWGRFLGQLSPEARDMLNAWRIRAWPEPQVQLLYELVEYVEFFELD